MQREPDILQQGVLRPPVGAGKMRSKGLEVKIVKARKASVTSACPKRVGDQRVRSAAHLAPTAGQGQQAAKQAQDQHPQQDRALVVVAPGPGDFVEQRLGAVAVFKGGFDAEITGDKADDQPEKRQADQTGANTAVPRTARGAQGFVQAQRRGGQEGEQQLQPDQRQGQHQRQMRPLGDHLRGVVRSRLLAVLTQLARDVGLVVLGQQRTGLEVTRGAQRAGGNDPLPFAEQVRQGAAVAQRHAAAVAVGEGEAVLDAV